MSKTKAKKGVSSSRNDGLDLSWMDQRGDWGNTATAGRSGLTLADISVGSYGE